MTDEKELCENREEDVIKGVYVEAVKGMNDSCDIPLEVVMEFTEDDLNHLRRMVGRASNKTKVIIVGE